MTGGWLDALLMLEERTCGNAGSCFWNKQNISMVLLIRRYRCVSSGSPYRTKLHKIGWARVLLQNFGHHKLLSPVQSSVRDVGGWVPT